MPLVRAIGPGAFFALKANLSRPVLSCGSDMRSDMAKVIVERPRVGSRLPSRKKGYRKYLQHTNIENLPRNEPMQGRWRGRGRWLNEHLWPMRRFLRSNVGRTWDKIYQDLCEHVALDNAVQNHVLSHIFDYVQRFVQFENGHITALSRWGGRKRLRPGEMYVCPTSGILKVVRPPKSRPLSRRVQVSPRVQMHWREDAWWEVRLADYPADPEERWDHWLERPLARLTLADCQKAYGGKLVAISKRLLKPSEVRELRRRMRGAAVILR